MSSSPIETGNRKDGKGKAVVRISFFMVSPYPVSRPVVKLHFFMILPIILPMM